MKEAYETGIPLVRHMHVEYPNDQNCVDLNTQFMLGSSLLMAPVLHEAATKVSVYLPKGM